MDPLHKSILVVGAARSGTYLLASTLEKNLAVSYVGEVNEMWKKYTPRLKCDFIPARCATPEVVKQTREALASHCRTYGDGKMLEKTPANALRLPFVKKVFPDAVLIHIIRDGRDAALSYRRKYRGDNRKVTKVGAQKRIYEKGKTAGFGVFGKGELRPDPPKRARQSPALLASGVANAGGKAGCDVGAAFPRLRSLLQKLLAPANGSDPVEVVRRRRGISALPDRTKPFMRCGMKSSSMRPKPCWDACLTSSKERLRCPPDEIEHETTTRGTTWRDELGEEELEGIACHIEGLLQELGYESSFRH